MGMYEIKKERDKEQRGLPYNTRNILEAGNGAGGQTD
jgi:hypothetical protein